MGWWRRKITTQLRVALKIDSLGQWRFSVFVLLYIQSMITSEVSQSEVAIFCSGKYDYQKTVLVSEHGT